MGPGRRLRALAGHVAAARAATESREGAEGTRIRLDAAKNGAPATAPHPGRILTDDEKRTLYHNGFVIIRDVVKKEVVQRIHDEIENSATNPNGRHAPCAPRGPLLPTPLPLPLTAGCWGDAQAAGHQLAGV